jgi:hypothetical protein
MSWPMSWFTDITRRLLWCARGAELEREIEDELRFHIEMRTQEHERRGLPPEEARAEALRRFGDYEQIKAACRQISREREFSMPAFKGFIWVMLGVGLTLRFAGGASQWHQVGNVLIVIAILWRLLLYLRAVQPSLARINAAEQAPGAGKIFGELTSVAPASIAPRDHAGRTPVERLIADEE